MSRSVQTLHRIRQLLCGLRGHDEALHFEPRRLSLRCLSCGHETVGWSLDREKPSVTVAGDTAAHHSWTTHIADLATHLMSTVAHVGGSR